MRASRSTARATAGRIDWDALRLGGLAAAVVLYLGLNAGGYDPIVRSRLGVLAWWSILLGFALGFPLPASRLGTWGRSAVGLFTGFVLWTALACTWSLSSERSLQELSRVVAYLGLLLVATWTLRDRRSAMWPVIHGVTAAVVGIAGLALLSRLRPGTFAAARSAAAFLPGTSGRLQWPLDYWNALAALMALGIPLLLGIATSARKAITRSIAVAAVPLLVLCGYLTFSRGGAIEAAGACLVFLALVPDRIPKLATLSVAAAVSAGLILAAVHQPAIERGLTNATARHQGALLFGWIIVACAVAGAAQLLVTRAERRRHGGRRLQISRRWAAIGCGGAVALALVVAFAFGAPARVEDAWSKFKRPNPTIATQTSIGRFGTSSGEGRYDYWKVAVDASSGHVLTGAGPGTFQLLWLPRAPFESYVENAHSLWVETYAEVGLVGLLLLGGFFVLAIRSTLEGFRRAAADERVRAAAIVAATAAFLAAATFDWVWQMPVIPVAVLLLLAAGMHTAPAIATAPQRSGRQARLLSVRVVGAVAAVLALVGIGVPLATSSAVRRSQHEVSAGNTSGALRDARTAIALEPDAASPELQAALVLELRRDLRRAVAAAQRGVENESMNWQAWLVLSRLQAESGDPAAALAAFRQARARNPRSPLFGS